MSVPKNKRSLSDLEVFHNATMMRKEFTGLLLRSFGIKPRKRNIEMIAKAYGITEDETKQLKIIFKRCGLSEQDKICIFDILDRVQATDEDKTAVEKIVRKYRMSDEVLSEFPAWLVDGCRNTIRDAARDIVLYLFRANSIYPTSVAEFYERRINQDKAIAECEVLMQELQYIISVLPVDAQQYIRYANMIDKEVSLIKGWRKSDNKILRRIKTEKAQQ